METYVIANTSIHKCNNIFVELDSGAGMTDIWASLSFRRRPQSRGKNTGIRLNRGISQTS
jgi:hypothetical protein